MPAKFTFTAGATLPEVAESVASPIAYMIRSVSPLLIELGYPDDLKVVYRTVHDWLESALLPNTATINQAGGHAAGDLVLNVDTPTGNNFLQGDEIQAEGSTEIMLVGAGGTATTVPVTRGYNGTTAVAIPDNTVLKRLSHPAIEDANAPAARPTSRTRPSNYTQIFQARAQVTRSMERSDQLGDIDSEMEEQVDLEMKDLARDIAYSTIRGKAKAANPEGTTTQARTMNGIIHSILAGTDPSVIDALGAGLDERLINLLMQDMWTKGGEPKLLCAPPAQRRRLSALLQGRQRYQVEDSVLGSVVERFVSDFGEIDVLAPDIFIPDDSLLILDTAKVRGVKLGDSGDPFDVDELSRDGLTYNRQVVTEVGLEIMNAGDGGHGLLQNLATA